MVVITDSGRDEIKFTALVLLCFNRHMRPYALMSLAATLVAGGLGQVLKALIVRDRPSNFSWAEPIRTYIEVLEGHNAPFAANSFPSGHAVTAFALASAVALAVHKTEHAWVGRALLIWAALVAVSRVYVGVHFPTDVIGGAAIGTVFGTLAYMLWKKKKWLPELDRLEPAE